MGQQKYKTQDNVKEYQLNQHKIKSCLLCYEWGIFLTEKKGSPFNNPWWETTQFDLQWFLQLIPSYTEKPNLIAFIVFVFVGMRIKNWINIIERGAMLLRAGKLKVKTR